MDLYGMPMKQRIKKLVNSNKSLRKIYTDLRYRKYAKVCNWILNNQKFIKDNDLVEFVLSKDEAFIRIFDDVEFLYVPEQLGGLLGLEKVSGFETCEIDYVLQLVDANATVLDIGANFGMYSVILAKKINNVAVHSFEPVPSTFEILKRNIERNRVADRIIMNKSGVADCNTTMLLTADRYAGNYIVTGGIHCGETVKTPVTTVDSYVEKMQISKVDFIKCDIEGAELMMLKGAVRTLEKHAPKLFLEISDEWTHRFGYEVSDIFNFLFEQGYRYEFFTRDGKLKSDSTDFLTDTTLSNNFFFSQKGF